MGAYGDLFFVLANTRTNFSVVAVAVNVEWGRLGVVETVNRLLDMATVLPEAHDLKVTRGPS